jgi:diaminohydroxyphosphoribosylaminopyrimidine deaminase/5-amino-6-(5-phosphoribosylamino)uracil reductase
VSKSDTYWMSRALQLAAKGRGWVHPNPMVGCVLVRGGKLIAEGYHHAYGQDHAEVDALKKAGRRARGATLYVNLEPCAHFGKTPPCMIAVAGAGIRKVVAAMRDPNPQVSGKGFAYLRKHGVRVEVGLMEAEAQELNRAFIKRITKGLPYVTLKVASSLDGRSATVTGESKWITGEPARRAGHRLRAPVDAIAVGAQTVINDNPSLSAHGMGRDPIRMVLTGRRAIPKRMAIFKGASPAWVLKNTRGPLALKRSLKDLAARGVTHLLVEGGLTLQRSFLEAGCVDEVVWFISPMIIGSQKKLKDAWRLQDVQVDRPGGDLSVRGRIYDVYGPRFRRR